FATDYQGDPTIALKAHVGHGRLIERERNDVEAEVRRDVEKGLAAARARPNPDPSTIKKHVYAETPAILGGVDKKELDALPSTDTPKGEGQLIRFAEAVRRTLARELEVNPKVLVFGEDV